MKSIYITLLSRFTQALQTILFLWAGKELLGFDALLKAYLFGLGIPSFLGWIDFGSGSLVQLGISRQIGSSKPDRMTLDFYERYLIKTVIVVTLSVAFLIALVYILFASLISESLPQILLGGWAFLLATIYMLSQQFVKQGVAYGQISTAMLFPAVGAGFSTLLLFISFAYGLFYRLSSERVGLVLVTIYYLPIVFSHCSILYKLNAHKVRRNLLATKDSNYNLGSLRLSAQRHMRVFTQSNLLNLSSGGLDYIILPLVASPAALYTYSVISRLYGFATSLTANLVAQAQSEVIIAYGNMNVHVIKLHLRNLFIFSFTSCILFSLALTLLITGENQLMIPIQKVLGLANVLSSEATLILVAQCFLVAICVSISLVFSLVLNATFEGIRYMRNCLSFQLFIFFCGAVYSLYLHSITFYLNTVILSFLLAPVLFYCRKVQIILSNIKSTENAHQEI